jgi:hypothetical protein
LKKEIQRREGEFNRDLDRNSYINDPFTGDLHFSFHIVGLFRGLKVTDKGSIGRVRYPLVKNLPFGGKNNEKANIWVVLLKVGKEPINRGTPLGNIRKKAFAHLSNKLKLGFQGTNLDGKETNTNACLIEIGNKRTQKDDHKTDEEEKFYPKSKGKPLLFTGNPGKNPPEIHGNPLR